MQILLAVLYYENFSRTLYFLLHTDTNVTFLTTGNYLCSLVHVELGIEINSQIGKTPDILCQSQSGLTEKILYF